MSNSINFFGISEVAPFYKSNDHENGGFPSTHLQSISLEMGDIDFQHGGNPNFFMHCPTHQPGQSPGKPGDFKKDDANGKTPQFMSLFSKFFGVPKQNGGNPIEKPNSVSLSTKRTRVGDDDDPNVEGTSPSKRTRVGGDDDPKLSSLSTDDSTPTSGSRPAGDVLPPNTGVEEVNKPIIVKAGTTYDGKNQLFRAGPGLNGGGTAETQEPVFILEPGAKLKNVQFEGGDGIHLLGDATLDNIHAVHGGPDDMITIDGPENKAHDAQLAGISLSSIPNRPANVEITNSSFRHSHDKAIQVNGDANIKLKGIYAEDVGQLLVTRGGYPITAHVSLEDATIKGLRSHLIRLDSRNSTLDISNVKTDNGRIQVMMGDPSKVKGATTVMPSTDPA